MTTTLADAGRLLFTGAEWDFPMLRRITDAIEPIALGEFGLDTYRNQIEVITSEQMLDAYAAIGMPVFYRHWSFGKQFVRQEELYRKGARGLAYEIVINSSPCISFLMEGNTATMQTLVIAHACFGHNHFFKNNYLFKEWTDAEGILDYLQFAKAYVAKCEEKYGVRRVELTLDAAHALMGQGVFRSPHTSRPTEKKRLAREADRVRYQLAHWDDTLERTTAFAHRDQAGTTARQHSGGIPDGALPEENILYFIEKWAPRLSVWQRELLRIVRNVAQYFYPQGQTKVMNEGCATYVHYRTMRRLLEEGRISEGNYLEFLQSHTNVVFQPAFNDPFYSGFNPYALGFAMMRDIERICTGVAEDGTPSTDAQLEEDRQWFPEIAGNGDPWGTLRSIWANYRDESFIGQFLSPKLMRDFRMFHLSDSQDEKHFVVEAIGDEHGYRDIRRTLARAYDTGASGLNIEIVGVNLRGSRKLRLDHRITRGQLLEEDDGRRVMQHLANLWGYAVECRSVDEDGVEYAKLQAKPDDAGLRAFGSR
ncbi:MAG TPA: SpoVR family protein [Candidatus Paceibacterota bacterium]|nr:SpoVR family protein [Candidatus Paceibacterota bacterium]